MPNIAIHAQVEKIISSKESRWKKLSSGCNSALEDAHIFAHLFDEWEESWEIALAKFTESSLLDAHALWEIDGNIIPVYKVLFVEFIIRERWSKLAVAFQDW